MFKVVFNDFFPSKFKSILNDYICFKHALVSLFL